VDTTTVLGLVPLKPVAAFSSMTAGADVAEKLVSAKEATTQPQDVYVPDDSCCANPGLPCNGCPYHRRVGDVPVFDSPTVEMAVGEVLHRSADEVKEVDKYRKGKRWRLRAQLRRPGN
jgi:hypothetical protein